MYSLASMPLNVRFPHLSVYVACSLTYAPRWFVQDVENFKCELRKICNVLCFLGTGTGASPAAVFEYDIDHCVHYANLVVAFCDHPSLGAGYEIASQVEGKRKPCLAVAHRSSKVSDLIVGCTRPNFTFRRFDHVSEVLAMVEHQLQVIQDKQWKQRPLFARRVRATRTPIETVPVGIPCLDKVDLGNHLFIQHARSEARKRTRQSRTSQMPVVMPA